MDREQMLAEIARLLPEVDRASGNERAACIAEEEASAIDLAGDAARESEERTVQLLKVHYLVH